MTFETLKYLPLTSLMMLQLLLPQATAVAQTDLAAEQRVVEYLLKNVTPGKPLVVSDLYNNVFTNPEERKALDRLFNIFFKVPIFVVQHKAATNQIPTLDDIARQFNLRVPGEAGLLLTIMQSDPRVPKFMTRDMKTGEITSVDIEAVMKDRRFSQAIERTMAGWEGKNAPPFTADFLNGNALSSSSLAGKNYLLYFWFSGCPPCMKLSPYLVNMEKQFGGNNFTIIAVNADRFLELDTTDAEREAYVRKQGFRFPVVHMNKKMHEDYGNVSVYPTLFLVDAKGVIRKHYVGYQQPEVLESDIRSLLKGGD
jgi:thiol-disulfide isomerase/thioredoxin